MDENVVYNRCLELPDGYEAQLMVLRDYPGGRSRRGVRPSIYRARVWIGTVLQRDPFAYRSQEHGDVAVAVDACYSMLLAAAPGVMGSLGALGTVHELVSEHFGSAAGREAVRSAAVSGGVE